METNPRLEAVYETAETRRAIETTLRGAGYELRACAASAPDLDAQAVAVELVLFEVGPREPTSARITRLRAVSRAPIVALAPDAEDERLQAALAAGADDFVLLPLREH